MSSATSTFRRERWAWGSASAGIVVVGLLAVLALRPTFFYIDDTASGAVGNWLQLGRLLREGQFVPIVLHQWMAGNYPVEGQGGLWNPVQMAINFIAPSVDNLSLLAAAVKIGFAVVLALGVYRVALVYGARPAWAAVAAASAPFAGFTLFFEQPSWVTSLIGMAWVIQAWASAVRYVRGQSGPIPVFVFLYLAISVGYVHAALMAGVTAGAVMIGEYIHTRQLWPSLRLAAVSVAAAACGAVTFLPGVLSSAVTWRTGQEGTLNDNFLTAPWSETITASIPSAVTSIESWAGETTTAPVTYIAWFLVPILAFVGWQRATSSFKELSAPAILLVFLLLFTAGPSDIGQIRWPARLLPFVAVVALIIVVTLVSRFGTTRPARPRIVAAVTITVILVLRAMSSGPQFASRHLMWGLLVVALGAVVLVLAMRRDQRVAAALLMVLVIPIALYQVGNYVPVLSSWALPTSQSEARDEFPDFDGTTLQLGTRTLTDTPSSGTKGTDNLPWRSQVYGNYAKDLDLDYVNAYTPVGHQKFAGLLCMEYDGSTCASALQSVFNTDLYTGRTFADLMLLDRVTVQKTQFPSLQNFAVPPGWHWVPAPKSSGDQIAVLERIDGPISAQQGTVSATVNATATPVSSSSNHEEVTVSSPAGGSVVFARLAWPGYTASLNGQPLTVQGLGGTFVYVDLPAGTTDAALEITFRPPGQRLGLAGMAFGIVLLAVMVGENIRRRRRDQGAGASPTTTVSL
ncbi:hypothetical protein GCM10007304_49170 [Rhodococcoides trifolii]|uniref:YfhO family protein n=1 Tax=Rhodococcoides trifolii TaxID=908250 RepID=A0A917G9I2_9NOCA|nr:hypothetical protein [Rhodococcus trifolii]GGG29497.1 hypothetical protein GCM10007304_49170 [Rhodococcus trifolii]